MVARRELTAEEQEEVQRLCDEEACVVLCDFVGEGELMLSEDFMEHTPIRGQLRLLEEWVSILKDIHADLASGDKGHFTYPGKPEDKRVLN